MYRHSNIKGVNRIIDANINRAKEGLRVCEEIARFILNSRVLTTRFKEKRHEVSELARCLPVKMPDLLSERASRNDIGKNIYVNELTRNGCGDIFFANIQRVKESVRVIEEFVKLEDKALAVKFKEIRYGIYEIEKAAAKKITDWETKGR